MAKKSAANKKWVATMSPQGRITIPKEARDRSDNATYWIIKPLKKGFEAVPLKE